VQRGNNNFDFDRAKLAAINHLNTARFFAQQQIYRNVHHGCPLSLHNISYNKIISLTLFSAPQ